MHFDFLLKMGDDHARYFYADPRKLKAKIL